MQVGRRAIAIATALILLAVGWFGAHHEAEVAHVREQSGRIVHGQEVADHHEVDTAHHLHGREVFDDHGGVCALLAVPAQGFVVAPPALASVPIARVASAVPRIVTVVVLPIAPYRLAPKTSPPAHG